MNIGYTAAKNAVYDTLVVVRKWRGEVKKGAWHLGSAMSHMCHKGWWHAFGSELAQMWGPFGTIVAAN